ncbi:MAG: HNH endonuclease signature motif containing protein, partial [Acidimicrobiia bacterium]
IGRASKVVTADQMKALVVRDRGCRYPGCDRPATWCQAHHVKHWRWDGHTALHNLVLLCSRHHHIIHLPGWTIELCDDATVIVTTPDEQQLTSHPPP